MVKETTTATPSIAAPRRPFYTWFIPGVFSDRLETVLHDPLCSSQACLRPQMPGGPWDVPGSQRTLHFMDGNSAREEVTAAAMPDYFASVVTEFTNPLIRRVVREVREQWWFSDAGSGIHAKWTTALGAMRLNAASTAGASVTSSSRSVPVTSQPSLARRGRRWLPTKPFEPVTRTLTAAACQTEHRCATGRHR